MKLRPRLTVITILLVIVVVAFTSLSTIFTLHYLLQQELKTDQLSVFDNFRESCQDALYRGDDLGIKVVSRSLEKSVQGLAYAIFVDHLRKGITLGGTESLERFKRLTPACPSKGVEPHESYGKVHAIDIEEETQRWRSYCQDLTLTNVRGGKIQGTLYLGFNMNLQELEANSIIKQVWKALIWAMVAVLLVGVLLAYFLSGKLTQPIGHLTEGAKAIGDGNLDTQIPIVSTDELGFLAQEFNLMAMKLRELDQLKDEFISSVSHELRSPLSAISGYVELLQSKPLEQIAAEKRSKALSIIQQSTERLTHFINNILDLAKLKSGHVELHVKEFRIREMANDIVSLFQPLFDKQGLSWDLDIPDEFPPLLADADKIRQVLTNLISNALKFTPFGGKIRILARNQNEFVRISVEDTGKGIPENARETIFERFKQVKDTPGAIQGKKGTGLGLAIARGIVESHGGKIWVESEVGRGTIFHFILPKRPKKPTLIG